MLTIIMLMEGVEAMVDRAMIVNMVKLLRNSILCMTILVQFVYVKPFRSNCYYITRQIL